MQSATENKLAAIEEKIAAVEELGKKMDKMERDLAGLITRVDAPKNWRSAVGMLRDTKVSREADELGREFRRNQTKP